MDRLVSRARPSEVARVAAVFVLGSLLGAGAVTVVDRHLAGVEAQTVSGPATIVVREATFGRTQRATASATWSAAGTIFSPGDGILTRVADSNRAFASGDVLFWIDEHPVFLIDGRVPAFRDLAPGARGEDVAALQAFLAGRGYPVSADRTEYSDKTEAGVRAWQTATDQEPTGRIRRSDVIFAPFADDRLRLRWRPGMTPGARLADGMELLDRLAPTPTLSLDLTGSVAGQLEEGLSGTLHLPDGVTAPVVLGPPVSHAGLTAAVLSAPDGAPACLGSTCADAIPIDGDTAVDVEFVLVPEQHGPAVPVAAIQTAADGAAFVVTPSGRRPVTVKATSSGLAIVDGVREGDVVELP